MKINKKSLYLKTRFFTELGSFGVAEVVVDKGRVQRRQEVEESLPRDDVTQDRRLVTRDVLVAAVRRRHRPSPLPRAKAVAAESVLGRRESIEGVRRSALGLRIELLVQLLVRADHLAGVALDPENRLGF